MTASLIDEIDLARAGGVDQVWIMKKSDFFAILALLPFTTHARDLTGLVGGPDQEPVAGVEVFFTTDEKAVFSGTTEEDGTFVVEVPDGGNGRGELSLNSINVIENGFSLPAPIFANPNVSLQIPIIELAEITPKLTFERLLDGTNCLRFNFDWVAGAAPQTLRTYCVDRSQDCMTWTTVMNVGMACPPVEFIDETAPDDSSCFYRIRPLEPISIFALPPSFFMMVGDPSMAPPFARDSITAWPNNVVTIDTSFVLNNSIPIIAPEIRLVPDPEEDE